MVTSADRNLGQLLERIERHEAAVRRRTIILSVIVIAITAVIVAAMLIHVRTLTRRSERLRGEVERSESELKMQRAAALELDQKVTALQKAANEAKELLRKSTDFTPYLHHFGPGDLKAASSIPDFPAARALQLIEALSLRKPPLEWKVNGSSPDEGFDSPRFAKYVLEQKGVLDGGAVTVKGVSASRALRESLKKGQISCRAAGFGDVVFYEDGYVMFRFNDHGGRPYVMGMTPVGILSLEPDFALCISAARVSWPQH